MMRLSYAPTSPFVRKVTALAIECGLEDRIQRVANDPWNDSDPLPQVNPLGKVPALQLEDGTLLAGSSLICQYLDSLSPKTKLLPANPQARWQDLALEALADGVLEASVASVIERIRRPEQYRWPAWSDRQAAKITRTLDRLETEAKGGRLDGALTLGKLTTAIIFGYLDLRRPDLDWRKGRPTLAAWYEKMQQRPSLQATVPKVPT
jgi:glutathione S-transferase